ncbi:DUF4232 domain-containing protein [Kitasatospora sp. RG8]|uniref:DUF4232 domain-containing protein n=1 Tax=Kitasatospora sp. RG8 TaxID=2820815 RepID=UPI001ADEE81F|nr:DUF4232 domain-containing protein [Kitasatospora sp. RG8]MBP0454192.1 DUF4232 domain-containing protein [Kitasatospora sp. RG8]
MATFRSRTTALAALSAAALVLTLTACDGNGGGDGGKGGGGAAGSGTRTAAPASTQAQPAPGTKATQGTGATPGTGAAQGANASQGTTASQGAKAGSGAGAAQTAGGASAPAAAAGTPLCAVKDLAISAVYQDGPPYTHIVLTAKNTTGHDCRLTDYPQIRFLESHREDVLAVAKSRPAAPVVLTPGAPAYALVRLSDGKAHEDNEPVTAFSVTLAGVGGQAAVKAPGSGGMAVDPAVWATGYWTPELRNGADEF